MSKQRVLLGLTIIAGGVCASLPFRREAPVSQALSAESVSPLMEQPLAVAAPAVTPEQSSSYVSGSGSPYIDDGSNRPAQVHSNQIQTATTLEEITALSQDKATALPMLPVSFQVKEPEISQSTPWQPATLAEGPAGPPREYRLRKLDTLEDLAERFLGTKDRAEELFAANRDVLKDRHVLPIGAVIRFPSGSTDSPAGTFENVLRPVRPAAER